MDEKIDSLELDDDEIELFKRFTENQKEQDRMNEEICDRFLPRVRKLVRDGKVKSAKRLIIKLPSCIAKVYCLDAVRYPHHDPENKNQE